MTLIRLAAFVVLLAFWQLDRCAALDIIPSLPEIKPNHPRLLLRPIESPLAISVASLRSRPFDRADREMLDQLRGEKSASAQAMAWLLTGESVAAERAVELMRSYRYPGEVDTFHVYFNLVQLALAYDWLYGYEGFTPEIKAEVRSRVLPLAERGLRYADDHMFHNYIWMSAGGVALWALATAGEDASADRLLETIGRRFNSGLFPAWKYLDGLPSEPMGYWTLYVFSPGALTLLAAQSAFETNCFETIQRSDGDWLNRHFENLVHSTLPDLRYIPWGDLQSGPNGGVGRDVAGIVEALTWATQSPQGAYFCEWLASQAGPRRFRGDTAIYYFLYARQPKPAAAQPALSFLAGNQAGGHLIARSGWSRGDTIVSFRCADHFGDHHHYDQGSFMIYRNGLLAVDPPVYRTVRGPQQPAEVHNTLLLEGVGQRPVRGQWFKTVEEFQKNLTAGRQLETGDILFSKEAGSWAAVAGQFAQAYEPSQVQSCVRQLLFLRPNRILVVDQLLAPPQSVLPEVQWLLQLPNPPTFDAGAALTTNSKSWLRCQPLLPPGGAPSVEATPVQTHRVSWRYPGGGSLRLAHLLEVGDGQKPSLPVAVTVRESAEAIEISLDRDTFRFSSQAPFAVEAQPQEKSISLRGEWRLQLDAEDEGARKHWPEAALPGTNRITLPNTTDLAGFGYPLDTQTMLHASAYPVTTRFPGVKEPVRADERGFLVRRHLWVGPAWYQREIDIPESWQGNSVLLRLERALWQTEAWVDGRPANSCDSLVAEHRHNLGVLAPGRHRLTVRVDNRMIYNLSTITHAYGPETQTRWNGLIGNLTLEPVPVISLGSVQAFPSPDRRSVRVVVPWQSGAKTTVPVQAAFRLFEERGRPPVTELNVPWTWSPGRGANEVVLRLDRPAQAWDEFNPVRYRLQVAVECSPGVSQERTVLFGFRQVERAGKDILVNGRRVFLRGTLDCAVYPRTGHPPMTLPEWEHTLGIIKEHGFNHVRFHTWCPPEAAFEAADRLGLYLQAETPAWVDDWVTETVTHTQGIGRDQPVADFIRAELQRMSEAYGNHPSFLLCVLGNEFGMNSTDWDRVNTLVEEIKTLDPRRLYAGCTARRNLAADDLWVTHHTGASTRGVGPPHTDWDFRAAVDTTPVPVIAHETGQRPVFPDYPALLPKFTGPLLPLNLERYQRALASNGLSDQLQEFVRASARFQLVQYKAEHEAMLRTRGYSGYQLLMLNDFTGQSEALVGILDPFWESKGVLSAAQVRAWNAPTVLLARFGKYVWATNENFKARLEVAHYGPNDLSGSPVQWTLKARDGDEVASGQLPAKSIPAGTVTGLGEIQAPLHRVGEPRAATLTVQLAGVANWWNVWIFTTTKDEPPPAGVLVTAVLDESARRELQSGGKVVLLAHGVQSDCAAKTGFESVYWSAGWWGNAFSSLGILCQPWHAALKEFPTDGWSDWQWRDLCAGATTFKLDGAPAGFRPIIQPVPDFHFNALLAQLFEAKVGAGSLLVCGYDLASHLDQRLSARQFRRSLLRYASSGEFQPAAQIPLSWVERWCGAARP